MPGERNVDIMKKVTIKDVAQRAGVSSSTVSMILNGTKKFPEKTYRLVVDACNELGYIRGGTYRERQAEHKTLIAIVPTLANFYFVQAVQAMQRKAKELGYSLMTFETLRERKQEARIIQICRDFPYAGVVFFYPPENSMFLSQLKEEKPVVFVYDKDVLDNSDVFEFDGLRVGATIGEHLFALGHRRIAFLTLDFEMKQVMRVRRLEGLRSVYQDNGYDPIESVRLCTPESELPRAKQAVDGYELGYQLAKHLIEQNTDVTAFVGLNDMIAIGAMDAVADAGKIVPDDYSVCGCDNISVAGYRGISLTTIDSFSAQVGSESVELLARKIDGTDFVSGQGGNPIGTMRIAYAPKLIVRRSTGPRKKQK